MMGRLFGTYADEAAAFFQILIFVASIPSFHFLASHLSKRRWIVWLATAFYALEPGIAAYALCLLTESLATSGVVFLLAALVRLYATARKRYLFGVTFWLLLLTFLRPAFLYLFVVVLLVCILWQFQHKKKPLHLLSISLLAVLLALFGYTQAIRKETGVRLISTVSMLNDANNLRIEDLFDQIHGESPTSQEILETSDRLKEDQEAYLEYFLHLPPLDQYNYISEAKAQLGMRWYLYACRRVLSSAKCNMLENSAELPSLIFYVGYIPIKLYVIYFVLFVYALLLLYIGLMKHSIDWLNWTLLLACCGNIAVMTIGSYGEYGRLFLPSVPFALLILVQLFSATRLCFSLRPLCEHSSEQNR
jgi:4-amino-4-deoxy-L-arabinose transferase-like glycosyltransferase